MPDANSSNAATSSKVLMSLPVGERVGIAFSGGLDTSAAVAWMRDRGAIPYTYTADLGQYDEPELRHRARTRQGLRRRAGPSRRLPRRTRTRRTRSRCSAGRSTSPPPARRTSTRRRSGRAVTGTLLVRAMQDDGVDVWGDGSTYKGNDIERFYRYGLLVNPNLRIYKPWLDPTVRRRTRRTPGNERVPRGPRAPVPRLGREGVLHRRQHLGCHARGQVARGAVDQHGDRVADHGGRPLGPGRRDRHRGRHRPVRGGLAGRHQRPDVRVGRRPRDGGERRSVGATGSA